MTKTLLLVRRSHTNSRLAAKHRSTLGTWLLTVLAFGAAESCGGNATGPSPVPEMPSYVNCSLYPDSRSAPYVLPWPTGQRFRTSRTWGHYLTPDGSIQAGGVQLYAIDVPMPIGTAVHTIRSGVVAAVEDRFADDDHERVHENWVMIRHADGTVARYIHLTLGGALVEVGEAVTQGQIVGRSGNSGESTAPHLHFDVQTCGPNLPPGYNNLPCGQTVPLSFRNTTVQSCGLQANTEYTAEPFTADSR